MNRTRTGTLRVFLLNRGDCAGNKFRTGSKAAAAIGVPANWLYQSANLGVFRRFVDEEIANFGFIVQLFGLSSEIWTHFGLAIFSSSRLQNMTLGANPTII